MATSKKPVATSGGAPTNGESEPKGMLITGQIDITHWSVSARKVLDMMMPTDWTNRSPFSARADTVH